MNSLFNQTVLPDEIIVSDDGSTDGTCTIVEEEFLNHVEVSTKLLHHAKTNIMGKGIPVHSSMFKSARNFEFLAQQATMQYVFFCDQDDVWDLKKIECFYQAIKRYPEAGAIFSDYKRVDSELNPIKPYINSTYLCQYEQITQLPASEFLTRQLKSGQVLGMTLCLRNDVLRSCIPFSYYTYHDYWCMLVATSSEPIIYIPQQLTLYRNHFSNVSAGGGKHLTIKALLQYIHDYRTTIWNDYSYMQDFKKIRRTVDLPPLFLENQDNWYITRMKLIDTGKLFSYITYLLRSYRLYKLYSGEPIHYILNDILSIFHVKFRK